MNFMNFVRALRGLSCAVAATTLLATVSASGALIRSFDSVPAGDVISGGAVLSGPGAPGSPASQLNNTASPGWGNQANSYQGQYMVGNANLVSELGTSSLSTFTLTYAYKPDIPNDPDTAARQFAIRPTPGSAGTESLAVALAVRRQFVAVNGVQLGLPAASPAARLMDGDPLTISDPQSGACCSTQSEWVFFAMTYEVLIPGVADRVNLYGMSQSEAASGLRLIHTQTGAFGDNVNLSGLDLFVGNTGFAGGTNWRPADSSFDSLTMEARLWTVGELAAQARSVLGVPEPSTLVMMLLAIFATAPKRATKRA